jgi:hypothetical protein
MLKRKLVVHVYCQDLIVNNLQMINAFLSLQRAELLYDNYFACYHSLESYVARTSTN